MSLLGDALAQGPLYWFIVLIELAAVLAAILLIGLLLGMTGFWILGRFARKLAGPQAELETDCDELNEEVPEEAVRDPVDSGGSRGPDA